MTGVNIAVWAAEDARALQRLVCTHLVPFVGRKQVFVWPMAGGDPFPEDAAPILDWAHLMVVLVSPDLLAEKPLLDRLEQAVAAGKKLYWLAAEPCIIDQTVFQDYEALRHVSAPALSVLDDAARNQALCHALRLMVEALKQIAAPDGSPPPWQPCTRGLPAVHRMPFSANLHFVGRDDALRAVHGMLHAGRSAVIGQAAAVSGIGGVGKTQLAVAYAYAYGTDYPGGVFWLNSETSELLDNEIAECGPILGLFAADSKLKLPQRVALVRGRWDGDGPRCLVIFDNCEQPKLFHDRQPKGRHTHSLLTSRRDVWPKASCVAQCRLDVLDAASARVLLQSLSPTLGDSEADRLAAELGRLPLALFLAGCYLSLYEDEPFEAYLRDLQARVIVHPSMDAVADEFSPTAHDLHVGRTFAKSIERLAGVSPVDGAARAVLLRGACLAAGEPVPHELIHSSQAWGDQPRLTAEAVHLLRVHGLLTRTLTGVLLHRLISAYVRHETPATEWEAGEQVAGQVVCVEAGRRINRDLPGDMDPVLPHLIDLEARRRRVGDKLSLALATALGTHYLQAHAFDQAEPLLNHALAVAETLEGFDASPIENNLAQLYRETDRHSEGEAMRRRLLKEAQAQGDAVLIAARMHNLADSLRVRGAFAEAEPLLVEALQLVHQGDDLGRTALALRKLADLYQETGRFTQAEGYTREALRMDEACFGPSHRRVATGWNDLGELLKRTGRYKDAEDAFKRALAIDETYGAKQAEVSRDLSNLSGVYQTLNRFDEAEAALLRALSIDEALYGPDHSEVALVCNNLGELYREMKQFEQAEQMHARALAIKERVWQADHPEVAVSLNNLGLVHWEQQRPLEAKPLFVRALAIERACFGNRHPRVARCLNNLGNVAEDLGDLPGAVAHLEEALSINEATLGPHHDNVGRNLTTLAMLYRQLGHGRKAFDHAVRAARIFVDTLGPDHPTTQDVTMGAVIIAQELGLDLDALRDA